MYRASTKGQALLLAIESGLVKKDLFGRCDIAPFLRFWDMFSSMIEEPQNESVNISNMFKNECDKTSDN